MPLLHRLKVFVQDSYALLSSLVRHPVLSTRLMFRVPMTVSAFAACERWWTSSETRVPTASSGGKNGAPDAPNPLRSFFDARTEGKGIWKWRHYFDIYHHHLSRFVGREVRVLEIGVHSGGSLEMWKEYFGPKCLVYGVDREEACRVYEDDRTKVFIGNQQDRTFWRRFKEQVPAVDIVIDDGGHFPEHQRVTLEEMLPHISPGGVYVCEDVHGVYNRFSAYLHGLTDQLNAYHSDSPGVFASDPTLFQQAIYSIHLYVYVVVIERAAGPVGRLVSERYGTQWQPF